MNRKSGPVFQGDVIIGEIATPMWVTLESADDNTVFPLGSLASLC